MYDENETEFDREFDNIAAIDAIDTSRLEAVLDCCTAIEVLLCPVDYDR